MFEDQDVILPDEGETAQPQADEETIEETVESVEETTPTEETEVESKQEPIKFKIKYNHEEQELTYDEAVPLIQKGKNYDKLLERLNALEKDPRLAFVEELAKEEGMDVPQYIEAVRQWREQQKLDQLVQQNIPEELAKEILESRKDREARQREKAEAEKKAKQDREAQEFFQYFKSVHGRNFDPEQDKIPLEVWEATENGTPLKYAYMEYYNQQLFNQLQVLKQKEENAKKAPVGSVTTHGSEEIAPEDDFLKGFNSI